MLPEGALGKPPELRHRKTLSQRLQQIQDNIPGKPGEDFRAPALPRTWPAVSLHSPSTPNTNASLNLPELRAAVGTPTSQLSALSATSTRVRVGRHKKPVKSTVSQFALQSMISAFPTDAPRANILSRLCPVKDSINLSGCQLTDSDMLVVREVIVSRPALTALDISNNPLITNEGAELLRDALVANRDLVHVSIENTSISTTARRVIEAAVMSNQQNQAEQLERARQLRLKEEEEWRAECLRREVKRLELAEAGHRKDVISEWSRDTLLLGDTFYSLLKSIRKALARQRRRQLIAQQKQQLIDEEAVFRLKNEDARAKSMHHLVDVYELVCRRSVLLLETAERKGLKSLEGNGWILARREEKKRLAVESAAREEVVNEETACRDVVSSEEQAMFRRLSTLCLESEFAHRRRLKERLDREETERRRKEAEDRRIEQEKQILRERGIQEEIRKEELRLRKRQELISNEASARRLMCLDQDATFSVIEDMFNVDNRVAKARSALVSAEMLLLASWRAPPVVRLQMNPDDPIPVFYQGRWQTPSSVSCGITIDHALAQPPDCSATIEELRAEARAAREVLRGELAIASHAARERGAQWAEALTKGIVSSSKTKKDPSQIKPYSPSEYTTADKALQDPPWMRDCVTDRLDLSGGVVEVYVEASSRNVAGNHLPSLRRTKSDMEVPKEGDRLQAPFGSAVLEKTQSSFVMEVGPEVTLVKLNALLNAIQYRYDGPAVKIPFERKLVIKARLNYPALKQGEKLRQCLYDEEQNTFSGLVAVESVLHIPILVWPPLIQIPADRSVEWCEVKEHMKQAVDEKGTMLLPDLEVRFPPSPPKVSEYSDSSYEVKEASSFNGCRVRVRITENAAPYDQLVMRTGAQTDTGRHDLEIINEGPVPLLFADGIRIAEVTEGRMLTLREVDERGNCSPGLAGVGFSMVLTDGANTVNTYRLLRRIRFIIYASILPALQDKRLVEVSVFDSVGNCSVVVQGVEVIASDTPTTMELGTRKIIYRPPAQPTMPVRVRHHIKQKILPLFPQAKVLDVDTDHFCGGDLTVLLSSTSKGDCLCLCPMPARSGLSMTTRSSRGTTIRDAVMTPVSPALSALSVVSDSSFSDREGDVSIMDNRVLYCGRTVGTIIGEAVPPEWDIEGSAAPPTRKVFSRKLKATFVSGDVVSDDTDDSGGRQRARSPWKRAHNQTSGDDIMLKIEFTNDGAASIEAVQAIMRCICFTSTLFSPSEGLRMVDVTLRLGRAAKAADISEVSSQSLQAIAFLTSSWMPKQDYQVLVDQAELRVMSPMFELPLQCTTLEYREGSGAVRLIPYEVALENGSEPLVGGILSVELVEGATPDDALSLRCGSKEELRAKQRRGSKGILKLSRFESGALQRLTLKSDLSKVRHELQRQDPSETQRTVLDEDDENGADQTVDTDNEGNEPNEVNEEPNEANEEPNEMEEETMEGSSSVPQEQLKNGPKDSIKIAIPTQPPENEELDSEGFGTIMKWQDLIRLHESVTRLTSALALSASKAANSQPMAGTVSDIWYGSRYIGSLSVGRSKLVIKFSRRCTKRDAALCLKNITYLNSSSDPTELAKLVRVSVQDGDITGQAIIQVNVHPVDDVTQICLANRRLTYHPGQSSVERIGCFPIAGLHRASLFDPDTRWFDGGAITVQISGGGTKGDTFGIMSVEHQRLMREEAEEWKERRTEEQLQSFQLGSFADLTPQRLQMTQQQIQDALDSPTSRVLRFTAFEGYIQLLDDGRTVCTVDENPDNVMELGTIEYAKSHFVGISNLIVNLARHEPPAISLQLVSYIMNCVTFSTPADKLVPGQRVVTIKVKDGTNPVEGKGKVTIDVFRPVLSTPSLQPRTVTAHAGDVIGVPLLEKLTVNLPSESNTKTVSSGGFTEVSIISGSADGDQIHLRGNVTGLSIRDGNVCHGNEVMGRLKVNSPTCLHVDHSGVAKLSSRWIASFLLALGFRATTPGTRVVRFQCCPEYINDPSVLYVTVNVVEMTPEHEKAMQLQLDQLERATTSIVLPEPTSQASPAKKKASLPRKGSSRRGTLPAIATFEQTPGSPIILQTPHSGTAKSFG